MSDLDGGGGPYYMPGGKKIRTAFFTLSGGSSINMRAVGNYDFGLTQDHIVRGIKLIVQLNGSSGTPAPGLFGTAAALTNGLVFKLIRGQNELAIFPGPLRTNLDLMLAASRVDVMGTAVQFSLDLFEEVELLQDDIVRIEVTDSTQATLASFRTFVVYEVIEQRPQL